MRRNITLYIAGREVELADNSFILSNYAVEDLDNPAVVKNSYTQQITIPGTPTNNAIFGEAYRLDRVNGTGGAGADFSAAYKTPFIIQDADGSVLQRGYAKLDSVTRNGAAVSYKVTLYGGLGSLLYDLSYDGNGNKRTLADLDYLTGGDDELNFKINAAAVSAAWGTDAAAGEPDSLWKVVNFAPAYNGVPDGNFAPGVAIGKPSDYGLADSDGGYGLRGGKALFTLSDSFDEWAMKDLRSYLQRPVLSMRAFLKAIAKPSNNGGHSVDIGTLASNAPFLRLWLTLPLLPSIGTFKRKSGSLSLVSATPPAGVLARYNITGTVPLGSTISVAMRTMLQATISASEAILYRDGQNEQTVIFLQAVAYDGSNNVVGGSPVKAFYTEGDYQTPQSLAGICGFSPAYNEYEPAVRPASQFSGGGPYYFEYQPDFTLEGQNIARIDVVMQCYTLDGDRVASALSNLALYSSLGVQYTATAEALSLLSSTVSYTSTDNLRSNTEITKAMLLSTSDTPADYLLGLCKIFGLYLVYDEATGVTTIMPREDFYANRELPDLDITGRVDRSKAVTVTPFAFTSKWYEMGVKPNGGAFQNQYSEIYGIDYGVQRINTGFDFNSEVKEIFSGVVFKNAATVLGRSRYWNRITDNAYFKPSPWVESGNKYTLYTPAGNTKDIEISCPSDAAVIVYYNSTFPGYDVQGGAKLELCDSGGKGLDGAGILVWWDGSQSYAGFQLTDDTVDMDTLNGGVPCWLLGSGVGSITIPLFRQYIISSNTIQESLDFGVPKELAIPNVTYDADGTMYHRYWEAYIKDRYDINTKVMRCHVRLDGLPVNATLLRRLFWYEGSLWALNQIINHSRTTWDPTECEFIQVQDINAYIANQDY